MILAKRAESQAIIAPLGPRTDKLSLKKPDCMRDYWIGGYKDTKIQRYKLPVAGNLDTILISNGVFILMDHLWCRRKVYIR